MNRLATRASHSLDGAPCRLRTPERGGIIIDAFVADAGRRTPRVISGKDDVDI